MPAVVASAVFLLACPARAQPTLAPTVPAAAGADALPVVPTRRVVVLPARDFRIDPEALFYTGDVAPKDDGTTAALVDAAVASLTREPELVVLGEGELVHKDSPFGEKDIVVRGFLHLGEELYRNLRQKDALDALDKGIEAATSDYLDVLVPGLVSDLYLYQGLSELEQGSPALAHVAFKNLFFVTPSRKFKKGYFPVETESALRAAAVDFMKTYPLDMPQGTVQRAAASRKAGNALAVVYVFLSKSATGDRLDVRVMEPKSDKGAPGASQASTFSWQGLAAAREQIDRALAAWLACAALPSHEPEPDHRPRFMMDTTGAYSLFLRKPTRASFHTAGFSVGVAWQALEALDTFLRVNLLTSFPDRFGDLIEGFTSVRVVGGVGYSARWWWGRLFLHFGLEMQYLSDFVSTENPKCKFFGVDSPWCDAGDVSRLPSHLLAGVNGAFGMNIILGGPVYLAFQAGFSAYFLPFGSNLNFPMTAELGLGYSFF